MGKLAEFVATQPEKRNGNQCLTCQVLEAHPDGAAIDAELRTEAEKSPGRAPALVKGLAVVYGVKIEWESYKAIRRVLQHLRNCKPLGS